MGAKKNKDTQNTDKIERILHIYSKIMDGAVVNKAELGERFGVNERSIQRDIDDIRNYMQNNLIHEGYQHSVIYDREKKGYRLLHQVDFHIRLQEHCPRTLLFLN